MIDDLSTVARPTVAVFALVKCKMMFSLSSLQGSSRGTRLVCVQAVSWVVVVNPKGCILAGKCWQVFSLKVVFRAYSFKAVSFTKNSIT